MTLTPTFCALAATLPFCKRRQPGWWGSKAPGCSAFPKGGEAADPALLNGIEKSTAALAAVCSAEFLPHRDFLPGDAFWSWRDLNRIEGAMKEVRAALGSIRAAQPMLSFTLGGDFFGA